MLQSEVWLNVMIMHPYVGYRHPYVGYRHSYVGYCHTIWVIGTPMWVIVILYGLSSLYMWAIVTPVWIIDTLCGLSSSLCKLLEPSYELSLVECSSTYDLRSSDMVVDENVIFHDIVDDNKIIHVKYEDIEVIDWC